MYNHFRPTPGRFGTQLIRVAAGAPGTTTLTDTGTLGVYAGSPYRQCVISEASAVCATAPISSGGTVLATLKKYDASATADVTLSNALDLEALTVKVVSPFVFVSGLSDSQLTLDQGDSLRVDIACTSSVGTQPVNLIFSIELQVQN